MKIFLFPTCHVASKSSANLAIIRRWTLWSAHLSRYLKVFELNLVNVRLLARYVPRYNNLERIRLRQI